MEMVSCLCGNGGGGKSSAGVEVQWLPDPIRCPRGCKQPFAGSLASLQAPPEAAGCPQPRPCVG